MVTFQRLCKGVLECGATEKCAPWQLTSSRILVAVDKNTSVAELMIYVTFCHKRYHKISYSLNKGNTKYTLVYNVIYAYRVEDDDDHHIMII
jgi:hypothetical protein